MAGVSGFLSNDCLDLTAKRLFDEGFLQKNPQVRFKKAPTDDSHETTFELVMEESMEYTLELEENVIYQYQVLAAVKAKFKCQTGTPI